MKIYLRILAVVLAFLLTLSSVAIPVRAATIYGPRIDELLFKICGSDYAEYAALEAGEIDLLDHFLLPDVIQKWSEPPYSSAIIMDSFREIGMFEFDLNNNLTILSYPSWPSPTSFPEFRHAIAHLVDKQNIIMTCAGGYGSTLESPVMPWLHWYDPTMPTHSYDPAQACQILYDYGWRDSADPSVLSDVHFPPSHPLAGQHLKDIMVSGPHGAGDPGLIFYRRSDRIHRTVSGQILIYGDATHLGLEDIGIPVDDNNQPESVCTPNVQYRKDFHIYTGAWSLSRDPDYLYDMWSVDSMNWDITQYAPNHCNVQDAPWNEFVTRAKYAKTLEEAETNCHLACQRFGEQVLFIPLYANVGYMAHRKPWHALNVDSFGVRNWWNLQCIHNPDIGPIGGQLRWGLKCDVSGLNILQPYPQWSAYVLDKIFDTLIDFNPLHIAVDMPRLASAWTIGTWTNPNTGMAATKITFTIRNDVKWIDPITGTVNRTMTGEDVKFSFQYVYDHVTWNYPLVKDLFTEPDGSLKITVTGNTITFYESIASVWAFHWLGSLPIIPKFIFDGIVDPSGFYAGGIYPATLTGTGGFYFSSYTPGVSCLLTANRNHFRTIVPDIDTNPLTIKIEWGIFKSNVKSGDWTVNVLDLIIVAGSLGWVGLPGDIPQDINKDGKVNVLDLIIVATNIGASW